MNKTEKQANKRLDVQQQMVSEKAASPWLVQPKNCIGLNVKSCFDVLV